MRCPFPGMDPYLERSGLWPDFHHQFLTSIRNQLAGSAPDEYDLRVNEEIRVVAADPMEPPTIKPDVAVLRDPTLPHAERTAPNKVGGAALLEPTIVEMIGLKSEEIRDAWLEVHRLPDHELVTVIEVLSPWNKRGIGFANFHHKRGATLRRRAHWVEIDLLVGGQRSPLAQPRPAGDFHVLLVRAESPNSAQIYSWGLRSPLPNVPIPLRRSDPDLLLDLADAFAETYEQGRLHKPLRRLYRQPPEARFAPADREWAAGIAAAPA